MKYEQKKAANKSEPVKHKEIYPDEHSMEFLCSMISNDNFNSYTKEKNSKGHINKIFFLRELYHLHFYLMQHEAL